MLKKYNYRERIEYKCCYYCYYFYHAKVDAWCFYDVIHNNDSAEVPVTPLGICDKWKNNVG